MRICELSIKNYRCIRELSIRNLGKFAVLVGANGSGKSSLLELLTRATSDFSKGEARFLSNELGNPNPDWPTIIVAMEPDEVRKFVTPDIWEAYKDIWSSQDEIVAPLTYQGDVHWSEDQMRLHAYLQKNLRTRIIIYSPTRNIEFPSSVRLEPKPVEADMYISGTSGQFRARVNYLHRQLANLITTRHFEGGKQFREKGVIGTPKQFFEFHEITDVFKQFFQVTGKKMSDPEYKDGEFSFFFSVPWRDSPLPLSKLSSGEQWILLFFVEMALNRWESHIILIDELEQHLHPQLVRLFISVLQTRKDKNQYWITTHSPTVVYQLQNDSYGLVVDRDGHSTAIPYSGNEFEVIHSFTGVEGLIPIGNTIVFLEGSKPSSHQLSADQTFFFELQKLNRVPAEIQFISVGHSKSVVSSKTMLDAFSRQIGIGLKFYAIRDRDALSDTTRIEKMKEFNGYLWIWKRGSIEGYFIEPELISKYFEIRGWDVQPTPNEVEKKILDLLNRDKTDIVKRFENRLIESVLPIGKEATIERISSLPTNLPGLQRDIEEFYDMLDSLLKSNDWRSVLAYVDCKKLLNSVIFALGGSGLDLLEPRNFIDFLQKVFREILANKDVRLDNEISEVIAGIVNGSGFQSLL